MSSSTDGARPIAEGGAPPRRKLFRLLLAAGAILLPLIAVAALMGTGGDRADAEPARVRREDLVLTVEVTGELAAVRTTELGAPPVRDLWDFKISFLAQESALVKKGDPVIAFDSQPLEKALEEKSAEYAEASKQIERKETDLALQIKTQELALAEAEARRGKASLKSDIPQDLRGRIEALDARLELRDSEQEVANLEAKIAAMREAGEADLRALRSRRDRAKGRVDELEADIRAMKVAAPLDGIVIYKSGWREEKKKVGDSTWVGEKVIELPDLKEMKAKGDVDEADAGQVAVGQPVKINLEAHPDLDFTGRVRSIASTVRRQSWRIPTKVYKIEISLDKTDPAAMRPAMRFRGEIETARIANLLVAPREAIILRPSGTVAWVKRGGRFVETPVKLGRHNKQLVEIVSGLSEGDLVSSTDLEPPEPARGSGPMAAGL